MALKLTERASEHRTGKRWTGTEWAQPSVMVSEAGSVPAWDEVLVHHSAQAWDAALAQASAPGWEPLWVLEKEVLSELPRERDLGRTSGHRWEAPWARSWDTGLGRQ